jgi:2-keto-4-pentenoate hydratase/2-oxohepta-3-ene-1,7-dioic acid hydratase in catechol pathway
MRLASFEVSTRTGPVTRIGAIDEDSVLDLTTAYATSLAASGEESPREIATAIVPPDMVEFFERGGRAREATMQVIEEFSKPDEKAGLDGADLWFSLDDVRLLSPIRSPLSIRAFSVFEEHLENADWQIPDVWFEMPIYYKGAPNVIGPGATVDWPSYTEKMDFELELCAVIGKQGTNIDADRATDYIAGYTIFNDFSARDIQFREMEFKLGPSKGKDFANGLGPYLVTPDEVEFDATDNDLSSVQRTIRVNGEVWSEKSLGRIQHSFAAMVEHAANEETLYPGDLLTSGSVGEGCGFEIDRWIQPGDVLKLEVEGIGTLENHIIQD